MKKLLSILLSVVMLVAALPLSMVMAETVEFSSVADETQTVWNYGWQTGGPWDLDTAAGDFARAGISPSVSYKGSNSMHLQYNGLNSTGNDRYFVKTANDYTAANVTIGSTYKLTMYVKELVNTDNTAFVEFGGGHFNLGDSQYLTATEKEGWKKFEVTYTATGGNKLQIFTAGGAADIYLDCIKMVEVIDGVDGENMFTEAMCNLDTDSVDFSSVADETQTVWNYGWETGGPWDLDTAAGDFARAGISPSVSYKGSKSMHLQYNGLKSHGNDRYVMRSPNVVAYCPEVGKTYKLTMYVKELVNKDNTVGVQVGGGAKVSLSNSDYLTATDKEGWKKFEMTYTATTAARLEIWMNLGAADVYLDCIKMVEVIDGVDGENMFTEAMCNLDDDTPKEVVFSSVADETQTVWNYGWQTGGPWDLNTEAGDFVRAGISPSVSYKGSKSMHLQYNGLNSTGNDRYFVKTANDYTAANVTIGSTYKLTMYVKELVNTDNTAFVEFGGGHFNLGDSQYLTATEKEGWKKFEVTHTATGDNKLQIWTKGGAADIYLDCIKMVEVIDGVDGENMFTEAMCNLDDDTADENDTPNENEWSIPDPTIPRPENVPDITAISNIRNFGWEPAAFKSNNATPDTSAYTAEITSEVAYEGKSSMHITFAKNDNCDRIMIRPIRTNNKYLTAGQEYKVTMYIKPVTNTADGISIQRHSEAGVDTFASNKFISKADKEGWYKYEATGVTVNAEILINANNGVCDFYVDNVTAYPVTDGVVGTTNHLTDAESTFETACTDAYTVSDIKLFDGDGNVVTAISAEQSGKSLTAAVALANYTEDENFTGEVIVCLYKDDVMQEAKLSGVKTISAANPSAIVTATIDMPAITVEEESEYEVRVFVWKSAQKMTPLRLGATF